VDLDSVPGPEVELIRGPRRAAEVLLGYLFPVGVVISVVAGLVTVLAGGGVFLGVAVFLVVLIAVAVLPYPLAGRRRRRGRDLGAGLPLAELGPAGARLRYEVPTLRERRTGEYGAKRYDAAVAWTDVTGWRRGIDPFGAAVLVLEVADPARVTTRGRTQLTRTYLGYLVNGLGSAAVIRIPVPAAERAAVGFLQARGLVESPAASPPAGWPVDGAALVRRAVSESSRGRAWPARSLGETLRSLNEPRKRR
jgi:hypothetical protein